MNSLNIVSRLTTPPATPLSRSRTSSSHQVHTLGHAVDDDAEERASLLNISSLTERLRFGAGESSNKEADETVRKGYANGDDHHENTPDEKGRQHSSVKVETQKRGIWQLPSRAAQAMLYGVQLIYTTITAPVRFVIASFYDERGHFSTILPIQKFRAFITSRRQRSAAAALGFSSDPFADPAPDEKRSSPRKISSVAPTSKRRSPSVSSTASTGSGGSVDDDNNNNNPNDASSRSLRPRPTSSPNTSTSSSPPNPRIRYKEDTLRKRRGTKTRRPSADEVATVASTLKSPSSPTTSLKLTRYPRSPAAPRPLVPRRQPSYTLSYSAPSSPKKTLIIDLDETLIHSMAKGGRMSTGHMVEVRMSAPVATSGVQLPPGLPILYYVHERPGCHEFLRKVCKWYHLVVFTASVQEYADPVIDWLERERKYFSGRYYRQHCTFRNGAYIKDLAQVEPDLSKVMILDNSPMSYIFHEDNAIPIEGWISDPSDNDLLHLIPMLEGLQYVTDVRALLALRHGQAQQA